MATYASQWFAGDDLSAIEIAVGEALANAVEHGARRGGEIHVSCDVDDGVFTVEIKDDGDGFDGWDRIEARRPPELAHRGYGIFLMRKLMDEAIFEDRGTRLHLHKRLPVAPPDEELLEPNSRKVQPVKRRSVEPHALHLSGGRRIEA